MQMTDVDIMFAGVAVADFGAAAAWYGQLFGRPADIIVNDHEVMWRFADAAWLYVVADPGRAGRALVALCVADLDKAVAEIGGRGIASGPIEIIGTAGRKAPFTDADGNVVSFMEVTASGSTGPG
jgi:predicted enzyme related to lactoylglutathione lyase